MLYQGNPVRKGLPFMEKFRRFWKFFFPHQSTRSARRCLRRGNVTEHYTVLLSLRLDSSQHSYRTSVERTHVIHLPMRSSRITVSGAHIQTYHGPEAAFEMGNQRPSCQLTSVPNGVHWNHIQLRNATRMKGEPQKPSK